MTPIIYIKKKLYNRSTPNNTYINLWIKKIIKKKLIITITITNKKEIMLINKKYRKIKKETNILTFKYNQQYKNEKLIGDIIISNNTINKESINLKIKIIQHWKHIILHGILHLLNYDHKTNNSNIIIKKLEKQITKSLN